MVKPKFLLSLFIILFFAAPAMARDIKFEASIESTDLSIGETVQLGLTFYGTQDVPAPDINDIDGFEVQYLGPSTMMTVINGRVSSSVTHMYRLLPLRIGKFQIGPFSFKYRGDTYASNILFVEVLEGRRISRPVKKVEEELTEGMDLKDRLFLTLEADKDRAYVNELMPIRVKLYVNRLNLSDIQLPILGQEGFSKVEFKEPKQYREDLNGVRYDVLEFKTDIFATRPGDYRIGPAKIKLNLALKKKIQRPADDFFGDEPFRDPYFEEFFTRYERHPIELESKDAPIKILPLPTEGRPASFSGAVGDYQFIFNASPGKVKTGDPITLRMDINGRGNFNTVLVPMLDDLTGFKVYEPQVKTDTNRKTFTQVLIPERETITQTPRGSFSYFDPNKGEYKTITQGPVPIQVEKSIEEAPARVVGPPPAVRAESAPAPGQRPEPERDIIYIKDGVGKLRKAGGALYRNRIFLAGIPMPLLLAALFYIFYAREARLRRDAKYAMHIDALRSAQKGVRALRRELKSGDERIFYERLFKTLQDYLGSRFNIPPAGITFDTVDSLLLEKGADLDMRGKVGGLFDICDGVRFGSVKVSNLAMEDDFKNLEQVIRYFERLKL